MGPAPKFPPGTRFNRLVVIAYGERSRYRCVCDCGVETVVYVGNLSSGTTQSCGCLKLEQKRAQRFGLRHGHAGRRSPTYESWRGMKKRCQQPTERYYSNYGGRGITVCDRWQSFENFLADMGERPNGRTLDRIDNNGDYEPGNCRWATPREQANNRKR